MDLSPIFHDFYVQIKTGAFKRAGEESNEGKYRVRMAKWIFEPGHTCAEFSVRHMMVTYVRGHFKNVQGTLEFDPDDPVRSSLEATINAKEIWTGNNDRDAHLKSADFLDVENHPVITFKGNQVEMIGKHDCIFTGELKIRGIAHKVGLSVRYLGQWQTPWWEDGQDMGPKTRAGFTAKTTINRHDYGVSWNSNLEKGGIVVGNNVQIILDAEAVLENN